MARQRTMATTSHKQPQGKHLTNISQNSSTNPSFLVRSTNIVENLQQHRESGTNMKPFRKPHQKTPHGVPSSRPPAPRLARGGAEVQKSRTADAETGLKRTGRRRGKRSKGPRWQSRRRGSRRYDGVALDDAMRLKPLPADPEHSKLAKRALPQRRRPYALGIVSYPIVSYYTLSHVVLVTYPASTVIGFSSVPTHYDDDTWMTRCITC